MPATSNATPIARKKPASLLVTAGSVAAFQECQPQSVVHTLPAPARSSPPSRSRPARAWLSTKTAPMANAGSISIGSGIVTKPASNPMSSDASDRCMPIGRSDGPTAMSRIASPAQASMAAKKGFIGPRDRNLPPSLTRCSQSEPELTGAGPPVRCGSLSEQDPAGAPLPARFGSLGEQDVTGAPPPARFGSLGERAGSDGRECRHSPCTGGAG